MLYLTFGTTHRTIQAERALRRAGVKLSVVAQPAFIKGNCGLAIRLDPSLGEQALQILQAAGCPPRQKVFWQEPDVERRVGHKS